MPPRKRKAGLLALLVVSIIWSTTFPVAKSAFDHLTPSLLTACRFAVSALLVAPRLFGVTRPEIRLGIVLGLLQFLCVAAVFIGLESTAAGRSAFLISLSVFMVPLANALRGKRVSWVQVAAALVALVGVALFTGAGFGGFTRGDWWIVGSAAMFAAYMLIIEAAGAQQNSARQASVQLWMVAVLALLWFAWTGAPQTGVIATVKPVWISVAYLGICAILTTNLQVWGQRYVSAHEAALIFILEPVLATVWSCWFLGETLSATAIPGAVLILGANVWSQWRASSQKNG